MASSKSPAERAAERVRRYLFGALRCENGSISQSQAVREIAAIIAEEYAPLVAALERVPETGCRDSFGNLCRDSRACLYCAARAALGSEGGK